MKVTFYSHYGIGDLHESRQFCLDVMRLCGASEADYAHRDFRGLFDDIPQFNSIPVTEDMNMRTGWERRGDHIYFCSWIGCRNGESNPPGDYVLHPSICCCVENIYRMWQDYLRESGLPPLPRPLVEYISDVDYTRVKITPALHEFVKLSASKRLILVCNGETGSQHAPNFSMSDMVLSIAQRDDTVYILTEPCAIGQRSDIYFTDTLNKRVAPFTDVYAISYLSQFCRVIVGRCSGAMMPTQTLKNYSDSTKTTLSFTTHREGGFFVLNPEALGLRMKHVWSPASNPQDAAQVLSDVIATL